MRILLLLTVAISASAQTIGNGVTIGRGVSVGAITLPPPPSNSQLTVTETGTGSGTVTSSPAGINCGVTCAANFTTGTAVTLTATPVTNSTFDGWSSACTGTGTCSLTMSANKTATALFTDHTPSGGLTFSPAAGTYTGSQTVTISYSPPAAGQSIFYTTDGTTASPASTLYTGPITVAANTTINAVVENTGTVRQNMQSTWTGHKLCAPVYQNNPPGNTAYKNGTPFATCGGGVGSDQPSTWSVTTDGTTMSYSITGTSGAPQILIPLGGSGCDSCTHQTQHFKIKPTQNTHMQNIEVDMWQNVHATNREQAGSLQCNQQPGKLQWQIDNQQGSWQNTGITDHCPLPTGVYTDVTLATHWILGDDGCGDGHTPSVHGGYGCTYFDYLMVNGVKHVINVTLEADAHFKSDGVTPAPWASGCATQKQLDLNPGSTSSNPFTASEDVQQDNTTCSFGTITTGSAAYTIH